MSVAVSTRGYDFFRSGVNTAESILTAGAVGKHGIKRLFALGTPDDGRGCDASPLVVPALKLADGKVHDVVFLASMGNNVYAYDANDGTLLWKRFLGKPIKSTKKIDEHEVNQHWGVLSTPVIQDGVLYGCTWTSSDGTAEKGQHFAFALDIKTGQDARPFLNLEGTMYKAGGGLPDHGFRATERKQRAALAITKGALILAFGTIAETATRARGWFIAIDLDAWKITAAWCTTVRGSGGGVWMAGAGPTVLPNGDLAFMTGNGDFDGVTDFGESFVRLRYTPPNRQTGGQFSIVDWWTPWTDDGRTGGDPDGEGVAKPANYRHISHLAAIGRLRMGIATGAWSDMDLGSGGVAYAPSLDLIAGAGKDGVLYVIKASNFGKTKPADLKPGPNQQNYDKLAFRPIFFTYYPPELDPAPKNIETLNTLWGGRTHHQHGTPISFESVEFGPMLFNWGENENGRAWQLSTTSCKYLARTAEWASPETPNPGGMPGGMLSLSCNGQEPGTAVLWACVPYQDANARVSAGRLVAYAATQFKDGMLTKLWDSQDWNQGFAHNKFGPPVVANGKVFVPTYQGEVLVFGLA
jgi:hypothetical protein